MYEALIADLKNKEKEFVAASKINLDFCRIHGAVEALEAMNAQLAALQAENAELRAQHRTEYCEAAGYDCVELGRLRAALSRVEAERDAAMKEIPRRCHTCKHKPTEIKGGFGVCGMGCTVSSISVDHYELCNWEWRGASGEE